MPKAAAAIANIPSLTNRIEALNEDRRGPAWTTLKSVPAEAEAIWEATTAPVRVAALPGLDASREREIVEALVRPIDPNDGHRVGNDRKEHELRALLAALPVLEAMELHRRLRIARADDAVAAAFGRLVVERRQRLLAFLDDARRRAAHARG